MKKKIVGIFICILFIISAVQVNGINTISKTSNSNEKISDEVFKKIEETEDKILRVDRTIGDVHVKYWEHVIGDFYVKGDSILLHLDKNGDIIKYKKNWCEIESELLDYGEFNLEIENYDEKQLVVFPDEDDCTFYYTFYDELEYPVVCWEVCFSDGSIVFYDFQGLEIGYAIPMPSNGFSMSGHNHLPGGSEDPWKNWRKNANNYFDKWCTTNVSISLPPASTVSSYVSDPSVEFFFEVAHGDYTRFRCIRYPSAEIYYHSTGSWNHCAQDDMSERSPMRFAFIGSCGGMDETGPGSFSDEFRKGQMNNTVTIGYTDMSTPAWYSSLVWQNFMFIKMDERETMYDSFLAACAEYPIFTEVCAFVGDENLTVDKGRGRNTIDDPKQPGQPVSGPGGSDYSHDGVIESRYGLGAEQYWIFEPCDPKPDSAPLIVLNHGYYARYPFFYMGWIDHIVKKGNIVVYPRYQRDFWWGFQQNTRNAVDLSVIDILNSGDHVRPELGNFAIAGHSMGGGIAALMAANSGDYGIPQPKALMLIHPFVFGFYYSEFEKISSETFMLVIVAEGDMLSGDKTAKNIFERTSQIPLSQKDYIIQVTDSYGSPDIKAGHHVPLAFPDDLFDAIDAMDYYCVWKLFDALTDYVFYGKNHEYCFGNAPEQRFMGLWSDGAPVKELIVTDSP